MNRTPDFEPTAFNEVRTNNRTREIAVTAVLLAIGAVLRMFSPAILGITPNFIIAMYCLAILVLRPNLKSALAIGLVGGAVAMIFSKSPVPALNLITEPIGAFVCYLAMKFIPNLELKNFSFHPVVCTMLGTMASGGVYVILNFSLAMHLPVSAMQAAFIGVVLPVTLINGVITQILYYPVKKIVG